MTDTSPQPSIDSTAAPPPPPPPSVMNVDFAGKRNDVFILAFKTGLLSIVTLGFYRFWMKTRLRRYYWSAIRPGGHGLEYVGDPWEKLLGFFIAVVILTFYIGIFNLLLMFVSFSVFSSSWVGYLASFAGVVPLWFYARYRARRYVLSRTRWRGVRFGLEKGAWGYSVRAMAHWLITILTLGLLWPRMTFWLEKYRTDRTYLGSSRLHQGGKWTLLYPALRPFLIVFTLTTLFASWITWIDPIVTDQAVSQKLFDAEDLEEFLIAIVGNKLNGLWRLWVIIPLVFGLIYGAVYYRWEAKRIMANHKTADGVKIASSLRASRVFMVYSLGSTLAYVFLVIGVTTMMLLLAAFYGVEIFEGGDSPLRAVPQWLALALIGLIYLGIFLMWSVLLNTFVTFPIMRHMALTSTLPLTQGVASISQRARDDFAEAEGFAEALDLGAAI